MLLHGIYKTQPKGSLPVTIADVTCSQIVGVVIHNEGDGKFLDCEIRDNDFAGLFLFNGGKGHFEKCLVKGNKIAGVDVKSGADPTVLQCDISGQVS